jgi:parvulin-like peptidyl-prolyl isomerase
MGDLVERIRVLQGLSGSVDLSVVPFEYLQELLNAEILRQAAPGLGINITDEDIDLASRSRFFPEVPEGQETDPGQLEREFENNFEIYLARTGLSREEYRETLEEQLQLRMLFTFLGFGIEDTQEQVEVEWIRTELASEIDVRAVRERLKTEDFAPVADEVAMPAGFAGPGGYVGWVPRGAFPSMDDLLFGDEENGMAALPVGEIADPVFLSEGVYIIRKVSGPETQDLSATMRTKLNAELLEEWRNNQLKSGSNEGWLKMNFDSTLYAWVADQVAVSAPRNQQEPR